MGADLNKDLRVCRVGPGGSLFVKAFFFLLIGVISQRLVRARKKEQRGNKYTWRVKYNGELYVAFGKDELLLLILSQLVKWT